MTEFGSPEGLLCYVENASRCLSGCKLAPQLADNFDCEKDRGSQVEKQVEDIYGPCESSILEHDEFFQNMRHRPERSEQHENGEYYQDRVRDIIDEGKHVHPFLIGLGEDWFHQSSYLSLMSEATQKA